MILLMINYHKQEVKHEIAIARLLCVDSILGHLSMVKFQLHVGRQGVYIRNRPISQNVVETPNGSTD